MKTNPDMPDEFDEFLDHSLIGWRIVQWCTRHEIGAMNAFYCNLCGKQLAPVDGSQVWPIAVMREHREQYRSAYKLAQERNLKALSRSQTHRLLLYGIGLLSSIEDGLPPDDGRLRFEGFTNSFQSDKSVLLAEQLGGIALGRVPLMPIGFHKALAVLPNRHLTQALTRMVTTGPKFYPALECVIDTNDGNAVFKFIADQLNLPVAGDL